MAFQFNPFTGKLDIVGGGATATTLTGDVTGSGTGTISTTINTFTGSARGLVPLSIGGTSNYLRADGSWATPPGTGGAIPPTEVEIDFGTMPVYSRSINVTDAAVGPGSRITLSPSSKTATGRVGIDDMEWDGLILSAWPAEGGFILHTVAVPGPVVGRRTIHYSVG